MPKTKVAILCGGISNERDISLKSGQQVLSNLNKEKYEPSVVEVSNNSRWIDALTRGDFEVAFLALHGRYGEDGRVQALLELISIPYTGSGVLASALCMDKAKTHHYLSGFGILSPKFFEIRKADRDPEKIKRIIDESIHYPCVVKPNESGSSVGITIVKNQDELSTALDKAFNEDKTALIQELIKGTEVTCGVLGNSNQGKIEALPPVEIIADGEFFDYNAKYDSPKTQEICPARIDDDLTKQVQDLAVKIHSLLGCDGLSRSDFILSDGQSYFLETNTIPGLTAQSLCPKEAAAAGMGYPEFLDRIMELALRKLF
ncbi:MAG: D-alanine--D-alanine ligase [Patescibacteria group bacterium]|nr:D-alanine--D-alanine ligase [Patescibacteria group bacterium]